MSSFMPQETGKIAFRVGSIAILIALVFIAVHAAVTGNGSRRVSSPLKLIGHPAPELTLPTYEGGTFNLAAQRGHVVVLDFWATWCGQCMEAMPITHEVLDRYAARGVKLAAVNVDDPVERITASKRDFDLPATVPLAVGTETPLAYGITTLPTFVVIDAKGIVQAAGSMPADDVRTWLPGAIDKALAGGAAQ
jgi:thiol-disulfide isomerase/thioredoxin